MVLSYLKGWLKTPEVYVDSKLKFTDKVSILIAARNEEKNIKNCIESLENQSYDRNNYELILLDDFSEDKTVQITKECGGVRILQLKDFLSEKHIEIANKKRAITLGVNYAKNDIIITTDADCIYGNNWLKAMVQGFEKQNSKLLSGPVLYNSKSSFFSKFLELDLISLMGITCAGIKNLKPNMVNGANLLFKKNTFLEVDGYKGNEHIPSGDDVFLMQKINKKYPNQITFLKNKDAIVFTDAPKNFSDFVYQRIRWTSKSVNHAEKNIKRTLILNYLFYLSVFVNLIILPFLSFKLFFVGVTMFFFKIIIDGVFFNNLLIFSKTKKIFKLLMFIELLHILYISILGFLSLKGNYLWKNRKV